VHEGVEDFGVVAEVVIVGEHAGEQGPTLVRSPFIAPAVHGLAEGSQVEAGSQGGALGAVESDRVVGAYPAQEHWVGGVVRGQDANRGVVEPCCGQQCRAIGTDDRGWPRFVGTARLPPVWPEIVVAAMSARSLFNTATDPAILTVPRRGGGVGQRPRFASRSLIAGHSATREPIRRDSVLYLSFMARSVFK
jgi:hypothetical protein